MNLGPLIIIPYSLLSARSMEVAARYQLVHFDSITLFFSILPVSCIRDPPLFDGKKTYGDVVVNRKRVAGRGNKFMSRLWLI